MNTDSHRSENECQCVPIFSICAYLCSSVAPAYFKCLSNQSSTVLCQKAEFAGLLTQ